MCAPVAPVLTSRTSRAAPQHPASLASHRHYSDVPSSPLKRRPKARERRHTCRLYVRRVGGLKYQARVWVGGVLQTISLGLHETEWAAGQAVKGWLRAGADPCRGLPPNVLPKWVRRVAGGFAAAIHPAGPATLPGPFPTPEAAFGAMLAEVTRVGKEALKDRRRTAMA